MWLLSAPTPFTCGAVDALELLAIVAPVVSASIVVLTYLRGRARIGLRGWMETNGHTKATVTNTGGRTVGITSLDLVVKSPWAFKLRHPLRAMRERAHGVDARADPFAQPELEPHAETDRVFQFDDNRCVRLPSRSLTGPAYSPRAPSRRELRIRGRVPGKRPRFRRITQLGSGQFIP